MSMTTRPAPRTLVPLVDVPEHRPWTNVRWLRRHVSEGTIPYHKVIGRVLIDLDDLDRLVESGRHEPPG